MRDASYFGIPYRAVKFDEILRKPAMKLMIVDDHAETRRLIREIIGNLATDVCECANGQEAVRQCEDFRPDFITMDLQMEPIDGLEATRRIAAGQPRVRIVVVTQLSFSALRAEAFHAGASYFTTKDNLLGLRDYVRQQLI